MVRGLFYGAPSQFVAEVIGVITCFAVVFGLSYIFFKILDALIGMRVLAEVELQGLDVPEMGAEGYAEELLPLPAFAMGYPLIPMSQEKAEAIGKAILEHKEEKT